jgi:ribosomal protein S18 acetylase RimI-like enzyme
MLTYVSAKAEQLKDCLRLMFSETAEYLEKTLELMQLTRPQFAQLFQSVGEVRIIEYNDIPVGFFWIEIRDEILHIHELILRKEYQRKGIGRETMQYIEENCCRKAKTIEFGVHRSNRHAIDLYQKCGYEITRTLRHLDFQIMQKKIIFAAAAVEADPSAGWSSDQPQ